LFTEKKKKKEKEKEKGKKKRKNHTTYEQKKLTNQQINKQTNKQTNQFSLTICFCFVFFIFK